MQLKTLTIFSTALLLLFLFLIPSKSLANEPTTENALITYIKILEKDQTTSPTETLEVLHNTLDISRRNNWKAAELRAQALSLNLLIELEDIAAAQTLSDQIEQTIYAFDDEELTLRYNMAKLYLLSNSGITTSLESLRSELKHAVSLDKHGELSGHLLYSIALSYMDTFEHTDAIQYLHAAFKEFQSSNNEVSKGTVLSSLGVIYADLGNAEKASEYFEQSAAIAREYGNRFDLSVVLYNHASTQVDLGNLDIAESIFKETITISKSIDDEIGVAWAELSLVELEIERSNWEKALVLSEGLQQKFEDYGDNLSLFTVKLAQTNAYLALDKDDNAHTTLQEIEKLLPSINSPVYENQYHYTLSALKYARGEYQHAYDLLDKSSEFQYSMFEEDQQKQIQRYAVEFDTTFQILKNEALEKDNELQKLKIKQQEEQKKYWIFLVTLIFIVLIITFLLLAKQIQHRNLFKALALKDPLTESPNRRAIIQLAQDKLNNKHALSVAIIDIDHFKRVNDNYGHDSGDNVLKAFSDACKNVLRKHDHFGRYGGEEWLLVLDDTSLDDFEGIFSRLRNELNSSSIPGIPSNYEITFSMGVAVCTNSQSSELRDLINRADSSLYCAKEKGRNNFVINNETSTAPNGIVV